MDDKEMAEWNRLHGLLMDDYREQLDELGPLDILTAYANTIDPSYRRYTDGEAWFSILLEPDDARETLEASRDEELCDMTLAELRQRAVDEGVILGVGQ